VVDRGWTVGGRGMGLPVGRRAVAMALIALTCLPAPPGGLPHSPVALIHGSAAASASPPVSNFTASINRLVDLVALAGSGILSLVWARVAMSWFSNDITKKVQAKDRARDALIGTLLFMAAVTGLLYGLAHWVLTGS
jgi:hypothetical protein